jgi:hypothetical protein
MIRYHLTLFIEKNGEIKIMVRIEETNQRINSQRQSTIHYAEKVD